MQTVFVALLVGVLVVSVLSFAVMGLGRRRRVIALAREAHRRGMRFSGSDPFDVARRYAAFELIRSGHSPHAHNVTYGRLDGWTLRAFDFRYELGHGTRRLTRQYGVVVVETDVPCGPVLMWHESDLRHGPMAAWRSRQRQACWLCQGSQDLAARLAELCWPLAEHRVSVQACGSVLMFCLPAPERWPDYIAGLEKIGPILRGLRAWTQQPA